MFWACLQFGGLDASNEAVTAETIRKQMSDEEWQRVYQMSQDKQLYTNLISSLFPTIHGEQAHVHRPALKFMVNLI